MDDAGAAAVAAVSGGARLTEPLRCVVVAAEEESSLRVRDGNRLRMRSDWSTRSPELSG